VTETDLASLYRHRFAEDERENKIRIWNVLCKDLFQSIVGDNKVVLDLACGYGEFINSIAAQKKYGVDLNPDSEKFVSRDVTLLKTAANRIPLEANSVDVVFTSNFLEHLKTKEACNEVFLEVKRVLNSGGKFIIMGPNIRYLAAKYWDFYDHHLPLSHLSLAEGLSQSGYRIERMIPRFLPYTTIKTLLPQHPSLVALYLKVPLVWSILGRQFLAVAIKPPIDA
jgi:ubiquinone/menaquinone biosynthesis C-methylase UbiE